MAAAEAQGGGAAAAGEEEGAIRHRTVTANGIAMHVAESGPESGRAVLFLHGFPELWYSWRHQMAHLAARGYRCVAPDLRGYGGTEAPADVASYTAFHVVGDAVALLDALAIHKVFVVGHDWGAIIAWYLCLFRPDRVTALVNTSVAFMRHVFIRAGADAVKTTDYFNQAYGPTYYICRFQEPGVAEKEFAPAHARHLMTRILSDRFSERAAGKETTEDATVEAAALPAWLTEADIDYFAAAFEKTGFTGAINYYRNMDRNWELAAPWADAKVTVPTKFIVGDGDLTYHYAGIQDYLHKGGLKADVPLLEELVVVPGAGHFIQQERAQEGQGAATSLPPEFRFHPTDEELILHYLCNRAATAPCPVPIITDVDIYKFDPWDLPSQAVYGDSEWYFFSPRDRKYPNGIRPNRATGSGYWKATGTDKPIHDAATGHGVGVKKALVFYKGRSPKDTKTAWIMHEYRLTADPLAAAVNTYRPIKFCNVSTRNPQLSTEDGISTSTFPDYVAYGSTDQMLPSSSIDLPTEDDEPGRANETEQGSIRERLSSNRNWEETTGRLEEVEENTRGGSDNHAPFVWLEAWPPFPFSILSRFPPRVNQHNGLLWRG
ncbi:hypothetical protein ZWY2020_018902 [Hordeum vulgare]|nr:hypothetical protein ZWY2020_018902 [Hordeum vulgare]